jgi:hypothetical protein
MEHFAEGAIRMDAITEFTARASLVAVGEHFQQLQLWAVIAAHVQIKQKVRRHTPLEKLLDCFINMLAGGHGLIEVNTRVRPDRALQRAFGRTCCAEQSTITDTLDVCTVANVSQLQTALNQIMQQQSQSYRHDYTTHWQLLDVDMTGLPAGRLGEGVTKGYFAKRQNQRGRQLARVLASRYDEILVDQLYAGKRQLSDSLQPLMLATEAVLELSENRRQNTIVRIDAGGGAEADINWLLAREYQLLVKMKSWRRAHKLAASVREWFSDPKVPERAVGWVEPAQPFVKPTRQVAVRTRKKNGQWTYHVLVCTLPDPVLFELLARPMPVPCQPTDSLLAALHAYDQRGGGLETQNRGDKQGLGLNQRNKQRFSAQYMLVLLAQLAHNLVIWTRNDLARVDPRFEKYGIQRTVRDVLQIAGQVHITAQGQIQRITLNEHHPLTTAFQLTFSLCK